MQMAGGAGAGRSLVTASQKGLVTTFSVCFCSGGLSFGRKSLQETLPCEHGEGGKDPREQRAAKARGAPRRGRGRGAAPGPRVAGGELCNEAPPLPPAPLARCFPCRRGHDAAGPVPRAGGEAGCFPSPRGVSGTSAPSPRCWAELGPALEPRAAGWGLPAPPPLLGSAQPPGGCPAGPPSCPPPAPPGPGSPLRGAEGRSGPRPYSPWMAPGRRTGFPRPGRGPPRCSRGAGTGHV